MAKKKIDNSAYIPITERDLLEKDLSRMLLFAIKTESDPLGNSLRGAPYIPRKGIVTQHDERSFTLSNDYEINIEKQVRKSKRDLVILYENVLWFKYF